MIHGRHPKLDLTQTLFTRPWWQRALGLLALVTVLCVVIYLKPDPRLQIPNQREVAQAQQTLSAPNEASTALPADYGFSGPFTSEPSYTRPNGSILITVLRDKETLGEAVMRQGVSAQQAFTALRALDAVHRVKAVRPGLEITLITTQSLLQNKPNLEQITIKKGFDSLATVTRSPTGRYGGKVIRLQTRTQEQVARNTIKASLYISAEKAGMPASTIISLIRALSYRVDFQREIRSGDTFAALYKTRIAADGSTSPGDIDYAELDLGDRIEKLYRFENPTTGRVDFFDEKGESMRRLLMRTPIDGARLTSNFGKRKHPVLGYVKSHQGVDFGASTGTPIYAAGDGVIERANRFGSYGNYVRIRHPRQFKTAYAHLSRFAKGMRSGKTVRQGDIIGYVGATGRVTGPHLHYEVYSKGRRVNPMRLDLPTGELLSGSALTAFKAQMVKTEAALASNTASRDALR